jgi:hypothetical protein
LNGLTGRVKLNAWPNTSPEVVPAVVATWESFCESWAATHGCGPSMAAARVAAIGSPGYSCEAESRSCRSPLLVVHHIKTLCVAAWQKKGGLAMLQNVILLIFAALASSFLLWHSRFKICRRCRSRIRRWASVCHVCGAIGWQLKLPIKSQPGRAGHIDG